MAANRGFRKGGADIYAQRQRETIQIDQDDDDIHVVNAPEDEEEPEIVAIEPDGDHEEPEPQDDDPLADLEKQLGELKKRTETVEAENQQLRQHAQASEADVALSQQAVIGHAIQNAQGVIAAAEREIDEAMKAQDGPRLAKAQRALVRAEMDLGTYEQAADELKNEIEAVKRKPKEQPKPKGTGDVYIDNIAHMTRPTQEYLIKHRADLEGNPKRTARAIAAHNLAMTEDLEADTPEYFAYIDRHMGYDNGKASEVTTKKRERPAAKPQVGAPGGARASNGNGRRNEVHLTAAERQIAATMGMTAAQYAKNKLKIEENGRTNADGLRFYRDSNQGRTQGR